MTYRIERCDQNGLTREVWEFILITSIGTPPELHLDFYGWEQRVSRRHGWKVVHFWERIPGMKSGLRRTDALPKPRISREVSEEAIRQVTDSIVLKIPLDSPKGLG